MRAGNAGRETRGVDVLEGEIVEEKKTNTTWKKIRGLSEQKKRRISPGLPGEIRLFSVHLNQSFANQSLDSQITNFSAPSNCLYHLTTPSFQSLWMNTHSIAFNSMIFQIYVCNYTGELFSTVFQWMFSFHAFLYIPFVYLSVFLSLSLCLLRWWKEDKITYPIDPFVLVHKSIHSFNRLVSKRYRGIFSFFFRCLQ